MKKTNQATVTILRGYSGNAKDESRLHAAGVKTVYRSDKGQTIGKFKMRDGEVLGVVDGLRVFGPGKRDIANAVNLVHSWGATIRDAETGKCSRRDGAEMLVDAIVPRRPSAEYRAMQVASVKKRTRDRMPAREALKIWRNPELSTAEAIDLITGWAQATAYNQLGSRGVPAGRRRK